jgi:Fe-S cluster biogenesis protein NfuA
LQSAYLCERKEIRMAEQFEVKVREVIERIRPALQMDGGDIEIVAIEEPNLKVRLVGACHGCPSAVYTLYQGVYGELKRTIPEFGELVAV